MLVTEEPLIQTLACVNWPDLYPDRPSVAAAAGARTAFSFRRSRMPQ